MRTLRQAAALLSTPTPDGLVALATALGFEGPVLPLDVALRTSFTLPPELTEVRVVSGRGALRALLVIAPPGTASLRGLFTRLASALSARTAHVLWTLIAATADRSELAIGCWSPADRPPRLVALVSHPSRVVASDAEALCAMEAAAVGDDLLVYTRWCELLGRDALSRRFYRTLEQRVNGLADSLSRMPRTERAELALLAVSRLLFLSFLQAKGWLDADHAFLANRFDECMARGGGFHQRVMLPLFFGTLNTPIRRRAPAAHRFGSVPFLNGGLFAKTPLERRHAQARLSDEALGALFGELLGAYRFTAREDQSEWSEVAIDPEMLGRAFESLMASRERRVSGAYYTPQTLVAHVSDHALTAALEGGAVSAEVVADGLAGKPLPREGAMELGERLRSFTVLDPACGSGAFLVYLLERIATLRRAAGDERGISAIRRDVLGRVIHGVDVNPMAVWLCELRLWLSVVIESDETRMWAVTPLPNLDCNVRVGDTLAGDAFVMPSSVVGPPAVLVRLRDRYIRASGASKGPLRRALALEERRRALAAIDRELVVVDGARRERLVARRATDLFGQRPPSALAETADRRLLRERAATLRAERRRIADGGALPFSFPSHFAHVHARGGFQLVIGNPPWVRAHNIPPANRMRLRAGFKVYREPGWVPRGQAGITGFSTQIDLAALFVERSLSLAAPDQGVVALLVPAKLWRSLSGGALRRLIAADAAVHRLEDWTGAPCAFDAAVYPSFVLASRSPVSRDVSVGVRRRPIDLEWCAPPSTIWFDGRDAASPWLLLPPDVRRAFDRLRSAGEPLHAGRVGRAMLGVKCGCNDAFTVDTIGCDRDVLTVEYRGRTGAVETSVVRPLLRGESVVPWRVPAGRRAIVWTHDAGGTPLPALPTGAAKWLAPWRRRLRARTDLRGSGVWWMLFRTEAAECRRTRVVWSDFGRTPRAALLAPGDPTVPLNSCYVVACDDPVDGLTLTALLNSPVAAAWLNAVAEPARGGWHRYLAWTVELLPLPRDWPRARALLSPLAERAMIGEPPTAEELMAASCQAYRLRREDVAPLVAWCH